MAEEYVPERAKAYAYRFVEKRSPKGFGGDRKAPKKIDAVARNNYLKRNELKCTIF